MFCKTLAVAAAVLLVYAPSHARITRIVIDATAPEPGLLNPLIDYDWGPDFDPNDATGVPTNAPPRIKQVIRTLVPKVNADGNEIGGVPVVLLEAPLGTYLGWNVGHRIP